MPRSLGRDLPIALIGAVLIFITPVWGDDTSGVLDKSLGLVRQVESPAGAPLNDRQRVDLLNQAIQLAQQAPNHRLKGHRVLAIQNSYAISGHN